MSALSHSNDDDRISPAERSRLYLIEDANSLLAKLEEDLATVKAYDHKNTSSQYQLACSNSKQRLLDAVNTVKGPDTEKLDHELRKMKAQPGFPLYTVDQLFELKEPDWLVEKLLPSVGVGILYAGSRQLKSFFTIGMAGCITNQATLGGFKVPQNVRVAFGLLEGFYGWKDRLKAYQDLVDGSFDPLTFNLSGFSLLDASNRRYVIDKIIEHDIRFLTIDTYSKASIGVNENSSNETAAVIAAAEEIAHEAKCCVVLVDHKGKDEGRGIRGSSAKFANVDFVLEQTKYEKHIRIYVEKLKNAEDGFYMNFDIATEDQKLAIPCAQQTCLSLQREVDQALADGEDEKELKARLVADGSKDGSVRSAIFRSKKNATD